jgi:hypothetical protein
MPRYRIEAWRMAECPPGERRRARPRWAGLPRWLHLQMVFIIMAKTVADTT